MPEIMPCPHCGCGKISIICGESEITMELYHAVRCAYCGMRGPEICANEAAAIAAWNSLPRALTWTNEPPKVAGEYWWRASKGQNVSTLRIWSRSGVFGYWFDSEFITELSRGEWAGPIAPPIE